MPEVVEVCLTALFLNKKLKNKFMTDIKVLRGRYSRHTLTGLNYFKENKPFKINKVDSKGKFMWFELTNDKGAECYILNRYGLSGQWDLEEKEHSGVRFSIKNPNNDKTFDIYFTDPRNFGTLAISNNKKDLEKELNKIGPDLLKEEFTNDEFYNRIKKYILKKDGTISKSRANKEIVKVLMDQSAKSGLGAGGGNYLTSSFLYDAKISPYTKMKAFYSNRKLSDQLADSIRYNLKLAYMTEDIGYMEHIDKSVTKFVNNLRNKIKKDKDSPYNFQPKVKIGKEKFKFSVYRQKKDPFGNDVKGDEIIKGRTTYWSPTIQKYYT